MSRFLAIFLTTFSFNLAAEPEYVQVPQGELTWYELVLEGGALDRLEKGPDLPVRVQRVGNSITGVTFEVRGGLLFNSSISSSIEGDRISIDAYAWFDHESVLNKSKYENRAPFQMRFTVDGEKVSGQYTWELSKMRTTHNKLGYMDDWHGIQSDVSGNLYGRVMIEEQMRSVNSFADDLVWDSWVGPHQNFSGSKGNLDLIEDVSQMNLVWRSEFIGPPEHGGCRYGPQWSEQPAGGGASPLVYDGKIYISYFEPAGGDWKLCTYNKVLDSTHADFDTARYKMVKAFEFTEEELIAPYHVKAHDYTIAIDAATGKTLWKTKFPLEGYNLHYHKGALTNNTGAIGDGMVFSFGGMGYLRALDAQTGEVKWARTIPNYHEKMVACREEALVGEGEFPCGGRGNAHALNFAGGVVVAPTGHQNSGLVGFDAQTGEQKWIIDQHVVGTHANPLRWKKAEKEYLVSCHEEGKCFLIDPLNGDILWTLENAGSNSYQVILAGDRLITNGKVFLLSVSGATRDYDLPCNISGKAPGTATGEYVYIRCASEITKMIRLSDGEVMAETDKSQVGDESHTFAMDGHVFLQPSTQHNEIEFTMLPDDPATFTMMGPENHSPYFPPATTYSVPMSIPALQGRIFVRAEDGIYCFDLRKEGFQTVPLTGGQSISKSFKKFGAKLSEQWRVLFGKEDPFDTKGRRSLPVTGCGECN